MRISTAVKEYGLRKPENHEVDYILDDVNNDCKNKFGHTFEYRCVYEIKLTSTTNNGQGSLTISHGVEINLNIMK